MKNGLKVATIVGARPQFIKAVPVSLALSREGLKEVLIHTGQHYDYEMSEVFFRTMSLKPPDHHLGIGSSPHGAQTGRMIESIENVFEKERPNAVVVFGDTNSTLAGALAASKMNIPVAHIEAGLRSFNREMPEEINRVLTDHLSSLLFAPTARAVENLRTEGIKKGVKRTGDIMYDTCLAFGKEAKGLAPTLLKFLGLQGGQFGLVTVHREENTDRTEKWNDILEGLRAVASGGLALVWPAHPRVRERLVKCDLSGITVTKPLSYIEMQALLSRAALVLTDSGGLQKEAYFHEVPCVTLRRETEWVELVDAGVNVLAGTESKKIVRCAGRMLSHRHAFKKGYYGKGSSSIEIARAIMRYLEKR